MKRIIAVGVDFAALAAVAIVAGWGEWTKNAAAQPRPAREVPKFQVSKGNLYTTEVQDGKRAQKFVFMGLEKK